MVKLDTQLFLPLLQTIWDPIECTRILYPVYVLQWPDDGCFTAETCSPNVIDISSMRLYTYVVF